MNKNKNPKSTFSVTTFLRQAYIALTVAIMCFMVWGTLPAEELIPQEQNENSKLCYDAILKGLKEKKDKDLHDFIFYLDYYLDKSHLSDEEIDNIIKELLRIQKYDSYQTITSFKGPDHIFFPNRFATHQPIFRFKFQKIANHIRKLPMKERIANIIDNIEKPPEDMEYNTIGSFAEELVIAGNEAVPFIIQRKPEQPYYRENLVRALGKIGDPRGIDYIIETLRTKRSARVEAAKALAAFKGEKVLHALIEALKDETFENIDKNMRAQIFTEHKTEHKPYTGRYYIVQHTASQSLSTITGLDWGFLFNEDFKTWSEWSKSSNKIAFNPVQVKRTDDEITGLIEYLFYRFMSERPNPWQYSNVLAEEETIKLLARDLVALRKPVKTLIRTQCTIIIEEMPAWEDKLNKWTEKLILELEKQKKLDG